MRRLLFSGLLPPPPLGNRLAFTLMVGVILTLNLLLRVELWPHTPAAGPVLEALEALLVLALLPQLMRWGLRWVRAYTGPAWLRLLATTVYMSMACVGAVCWLLVLLSGVVALAFG